MTDPFLIAANFPPLVAPQSSPAKVTQIAQASSTDATSVCQLENPVVPCHTHLTRPLASRVSVWTVSLLGTFLLYKGSIKTLFVRSFIFFLLSTSRRPLQPFPFYLSAIDLERCRFCLTLVDGAPAVAHLHMIQYNFFHSGRHLRSPSSLAGPQLPSLPVPSPPPLCLRVVSLYCTRVYKHPLLALSKAGNRAHFILISVCVPWSSPDHLTAN